MSEQQTEQQAPSKEDVIKFFQEQIEVKKYQVELQELNTALAMGRAEELKALSFIAQMTTAPKSGGEPFEGGVPHKITEEDMELNPELAEQGLKVGDDVIIPNAPKEEKRSLKKK